MCGVVGQVKAAFYRQGCILGVAQPCMARTFKAFEFPTICRFSLEYLAGPVGLSNGEGIIVSDNPGFWLTQDAG